MSSALKLLGLDGVEVFQGRAFETSKELGNRIVPLLPKENLWIIKEKREKKQKNKNLNHGTRLPCSVNIKESSFHYKKAFSEPSIKRVRNTQLPFRSKHTNLKVTGKCRGMYWRLGTRYSGRLSFPHPPPDWNALKIFMSPKKSLRLIFTFAGAGLLHLSAFYQ